MHNKTYFLNLTHFIALFRQVSLYSSQLISGLSIGN